VAFEPLGLRFMLPHLVPHGQPEGEGIELPSLLFPLILAIPITPTMLRSAFFSNQ